MIKPILATLLSKRAVGRTAYYRIGLTVAVLTPGILTFSTIAEGEIFVAVDEGVLVKTGLDVLVSVRNALVDSDLTKLRAAVEQDFLAINEQALQVRALMAKLESGFLHKFVSFKQQ